jgi:hypothetical protein
MVTTIRWRIDVTKAVLLELDWHRVEEIASRLIGLGRHD